MSMQRLASATCLALAAIALPACQVNIDREGYVEREDKRFPAEGLTDVHLYTFDGPIEVRSWDRPEILVEIEKHGQDKEAVAKIQVLTDRTGHRIQIEARHPAGRSTFIGIGSRRSTT